MNQNFVFGLLIISFLTIGGLAYYTVQISNNLKTDENKITYLHNKLTDLQLLNAQLQNRTTKDEETIKENTNKINSLENRVNTLEYKFNTTITTQQERITQLQNSLEEYNTELANRLNWLQSNAEIKGLPEYSYERSALNKCVDGDTINLGCVWYIIHDKMGIHYINDTYNKADNIDDELSNLTEIYNKGGGDCEDLSLLFAASVRYLMDDYGITHFKGWKSGNSKFIIYETNTTQYYISNADEYSFTAKNVYVTCYDTGVLKNNIEIGHCIVSFCKDNINDVNEIKDCIQIEPQAYGEVTTVGPIWLYISPNNLCMNVSNKTKCFTDFKNEIEEILK